MSYSENEFLKRLGEPEYLRKLRQQRDRIKDARDREIQEAWNRMDAARLRREITEAGEEPVA